MHDIFKNPNNFHLEACYFEFCHFLQALFSITILLSHTKPFIDSRVKIIVKKRYIMIPWYEIELILFISWETELIIQYKKENTLIA